MLEQGHDLEAVILETGIVGEGQAEVAGVAGTWSASVGASSVTSTGSPTRTAWAKRLGTLKSIFTGFTICALKPSARVRSMSR